MISGEPYQELAMLFRVDVNTLLGLPSDRFKHEDLIGDLEKVLGKLRSGLYFK